MCAVRKAQLRWQDATFSVPHVSVRCSRPQPDGCKEEYCEGKQKREAEQSERRKEEPEKEKIPKAVRQLTAIYVALVLVAAGAIGGGVFWAVHSTRVTEELIAENTQESTTEEESTVPAAIEETEETQETEPETETETETETEMLVELTEDNIDGYVKVESCKIVQGTGTFSVKALVEEKPASDDDNFYLLKIEHVR